LPRAKEILHLDELARELAARPTAALGASKRPLTDGFDTSLETQLAAEAEAMANAVRTEDFERGYGAFFEDGETEFVGR
jgi:2-(1,2-epoxy-1,2-dihydrophenyl)acetyl-CoA isomerase